MGPKQQVFAGLAQIAHALAHAHRLELLEHLGQGERSVEDLAARAGLTLANASRHLQLLRRAALVEGRRDGKRVYWTNSLYSTWDDQFYPDGVPGAQVMANAGLDGGLELAHDYWVNFPDGYRAHQIRLEGGDCSTDSFCYPSA